jgi:alpha/beta superfamily hydrolase
MTGTVSLGKRWQNFQASKTQLFWACAACAVATIVVGFTWGGWVTGGTANQRAATAATEARAQLAASVCVERFAKGPDAPAQLAALKGSESWKRDTFIEAGGWATLAGMDKPVAGAASLCVQELMATAKTAS